MLESIDDMKAKAFLLAWMTLFILMVISNHATKCTDVLMYDISLISLIVLGVVIFLVAYDNIP